MTQPNALRLADVLEATDQMHANADLTSAEVAAELRRLHARVTELEAQAAPAECHHRPPCAECVAAELADDTIIGSSAWWAAMRKPTRTVTYVCPVCAASLERQE
jgi:hypothetical protein